MGLDRNAEIIGLAALVANVPGCLHEATNVATGGHGFIGSCHALSTKLVGDTPYCDVHGEGAIKARVWSGPQVRELWTAKYVRRLEQSWRGEGS